MIIIAVLFLVLFLLWLSKIKNILLFRPELAFGLTVWTFVLSFTVLRMPVLAYPISLSTLGYLITSALALCFGSLIVPNRRAEFSFRKIKSDNLMILFASIVIIGALAYFKAVDREITFDIAATRLLQRIEGFGSSPLLQVQKMAMPFSLILIYLIIFTEQKKWTRYFTIFSILFTCTINFLFTAGRADTFAISLFSVICLFVKNKQIFVQNIRRNILIVAMCFVFFVGINSLFSFIRLFGGSIIDPVMEAGKDEASEFLRMLGWPGRPPDPILLTVWLSSEYLSNQIMYFEMFLNQFTDAPLWGLHSFPSLGNFVKFNWMEHKLNVDALYTVYGINWNVWASSLRDLVLDFGYYIAPIVMFFIGVISGLCRRFSTQYRSVSFLYCLTLQWIVFSPFYSYTTNRTFEIACYYGLIWIFIELITRGGRRALYV